MKTLATLGSLVLLVSMGYAQPAGGEKKGEGGKAASPDAAFAAKAAMGGLFEVRINKMAMERAANSEVKKMAQQMFDDHTKANEELARIAKAKNLQVPTEIDREHQQIVTQLDQLNGAEFDKMWVRIQIPAHEKSVELFDKEAEGGKDPELKGFANKVLPTVKKHLEMVKGIADTKAGAGKP